MSRQNIVTTPRLFYINEIQTIRTNNTVDDQKSIRVNETDAHGSTRINETKDYKV